MAISLSALQALHKQATQAPQMDPGSQAMALAAQAAKPPGAPPLPKPIQQEDPAGQALSAEQQEMEKEKLEEQRRAELAKKDNEIHALQGELQKAQIENDRAKAEAAIAAKEQKSREALQAEREKLEQQKAQAKSDETNRKTLANAEAIKHQAKLDTQTAKQQVAIAQDKAKALMDIAKQNAQSYVKTTDEARRKADEYYAGRQAQWDSQHSGVSTALEKQMTGAIAAMSNIGKLRAKAKAKSHFIPVPGELPIEKEASSVQQAGPSQSIQQPPAADQTTPKPKTDKAVAKAQPGANPNTAVQSAPTANTQQTAAPNTQQTSQTQSTAIPQPGAQPAVSDAKARGAAYLAKKQKQMYYDRLNAVRNEFWDTSKVMTAGQQAIALARMRSAMDEAKTKGDEQRYGLLQHAYTNMSGFADWSKGVDQDRAANGDLKAKKQLAELGDLEYKRTNRTWRTLVNYSPLGWLASAQRGIMNTISPGTGDRAWGWLDEKKESRLDQIANEFKTRHANANKGFWGKAGDITGALVNGIVSPITGVFSAVDDWQQSADMAKRRGVERTWFGDDKGNSDMLADYRRAATEYGVGTSTWSNLGRVAGNTAIAAGDVGLMLLTGGTSKVLTTGARAAHTAYRAGTAASRAQRMRQSMQAFGNTMRNSKAIKAQFKADRKALYQQRGYNWAQRAGYAVAHSPQTWAIPTSMVAMPHQFTPNQVDAGQYSGYWDAMQQAPYGDAAQPTSYGGTGQQDYWNMFKSGAVAKPTQPQQPAQQPHANKSIPLRDGLPLTIHPETAGNNFTAQHWNSGFNSANWTKTDPYDNPSGRFLRTISPIVQSLTGGAVQLYKPAVRPRRQLTPYDSQRIALGVLDRSRDERFQAPEDRGVNPVYKVLLRQWTEAHTPRGVANYNPFPTGYNPYAFNY